MKFEYSELLLTVIQFAAWLACGGCFALSVINSISRNPAIAPLPLVAAGVAFAAVAIGATIGRVQIRTLDELSEIAKAMREDRFNRK